MTEHSWQPERDDVKPVCDAVGDLGHLRLHSTAATEFYVAVAAFLGGSLDKADALVADLPVDQAAEHRVYWLKGNSLGSLAVKAHAGAEGANEPAVITGFVRSLDEAKVEILSVTAEWPFSGGFPAIYPDVRILIADDVDVTIRVSSWDYSAGRNRAADFVAKLLDAVARRS
jgi:hypothetical protein